MESIKSIEEIFFKYLSELKFEQQHLDYNIVEKHASVLESISNMSNSGTSIFDLNKRQIIFYSSNYGELLGYKLSDYKDIGQMFFGNKIHPEDTFNLSTNGVTIYKIFNNLSNDAKLNHKLVSEYRMLNSKNNYVRLVEQYQVLELDNKGQIWLMFLTVDISPNQDISEGSKSQFLNFRTGNIIQIDSTQKIQYELTKRELEILKMVKEGLLSKEISDKLSISLHTVNTHRQRVLEKLGANNSLEAIMFASKYGLLD